MSERPSPTNTNTDLADLLDRLEELEDAVDDPGEREQVRETLKLARRVPRSRVFGQVISGFTRADKGEAFVGSVLFGLPMLVEDGVLAVGAFLASHPLLYAFEVAFSIFLVYGIVYVADFQQVQITNPYFGVVPRRLVWVVAIAYGTAFLLMTLWGRVTWADPWVDLCRVTVTFTAMAVGAALGDILPGSSTEY